MSASFDFDAPDHFTAGAVGPPGQRVFYIQARQARRIVTLKVEKGQVNALAEYLSGLLARMKGEAAAPADLALLEPVEPAWDVGALGVGYDEAKDRILVEATEVTEEEEEEGEGEAAAAPEPAAARFRITRAQAAGFVERAQALMRASRPSCPFCTQPMDPAGHICPRKNGHAPHRP